MAVALSEHDNAIERALATAGYLVVPLPPSGNPADAPDAVVLDASREGALKALESLRRREGVVAVPAVILGDADAAAIEVGADVFLARPVKPEEVLARLRALTSMASPGPAPLGPPLGDAPRRSSRSSLPPVSLSGPLSSLLRAAVLDAGGEDLGLDLAMNADESIDELVPPELLEPLDAPLDAFGDENTLTAVERPASQVTLGRRMGPLHSSPPTPVLSPLPVDGDLRLSGVLGRFGTAVLLAAASRVRATGVLALHDPRGNVDWSLALSGGHLLALRSSRAEDQIGPLLVRLGYVPREAARFAAVPLDAGPRGAAVLAARGYIAPDALTLALARVAQELVYDLLCLEGVAWEMRGLETSMGIPLSTRALDALLLQGARVRIEPAEAYNVLGGDGASVTLRGDPAALLPLPLTPAERAAALAAKGTLVAQLLRAHGEGVLPALAALFWLQLLRAEGPAHEADPARAGPLGAERTRVRALLEAGEQRDFFAVLGLSQWATRAAARVALDARRVELDTLRARYPSLDALPTLFAILDEVGQLLQDPEAWERYTLAIRAVGDGPGTYRLARPPTEP
ncbi:MAG: response regulator transcription factor [Deltaproteobacteria bacterium]|nr:response regulator transcription factor [Deltaproteobacteria bacterium]